MRNLIFLLLLWTVAALPSMAQIQLIGSQYNVGLGVIQVSKWDAIASTLITTVPTSANGIVVGSSVQDAYTGKYYFRSQAGLVGVGFSPDTAAVVATVQLTSNAEIDMANGKIFAVDAVPLFDSLGALVGQRVDFLEYNLGNSTETVIGSISGNTGILNDGSAYDSNDGDYYFLGIDSALGLCLYIVPTRGTQFSFTKMPLNVGSRQVFEMEYDNTYDVLYALAFDSTANPNRHIQIHFVDDQTGNLSLAADFPDLETYQMGSSCYDQATNSYVFYAIDTAGAGGTRIYNTQSHVRSNGNLPLQNLGDLQCDNTVFAYEKYGAVGIAEPGGVSFALYPNPVRGQLRISFAEKSVSLEIMDVQGRIVQHCSPASTALEVDVQGFAPGIYWVKSMGQQGRMHSVKFVVQ